MFDHFKTPGRLDLNLKFLYPVEFQNVAALGEPAPLHAGPLAYSLFPPRFSSGALSCTMRGLVDILVHAAPFTSPPHSPTPKTTAPPQCPGPRGVHTVCGLLREDRLRGFA